MQKKLLQDVQQYTKRHQRRRIRGRFVRFMACVVVFCTTYALILPAITMEKQQCGLEEHTHSESCYQKVEAEPVVSLACTYESLGVHEHTSDCFDSENNLLCGFADFVVHQHNDACRDGSGNLVCRLPVIKEHKHTEDCYWIPEEETPAPKATEAAHVHDESCYTACRGDLICQIPERAGHSHGDACYGRGDLVCQIPEQEGHTHSKSCRETVLTCDVTADPHHHTDGCYEQLVCELEEDENHTHSDECSGLVLDCDLTEEPHEHTDGCYETVTVCDLPEQEGHAHSDACYNSTLVCELAEEEGHAHTDSCYEEILAVTCGLEEGVPSEAEEEEDTEAETAEPVLVCEKEEIRLHTHGETCYETSQDGSGKWLICTKLEVLSHSHGEDCFVTEEIPAEDETVLTCTLSEGHVHGEGCYDEAGELTCTEAENHTHGDLCYGTWELICGKEEHTHTDECLGAEETEETTAPTGATEETTGATEETTGSTEETTAPTEETTGATEETTAPTEHVHTEECYELQLVCTWAPHVHEENCYTADGTLVCLLDPSEAHEHSDACYEKVLICTVTEETVADPLPYLCGMEEHTHDENCRDENGELICGQEEHTHTDECRAAEDSEKTTAPTDPAEDIKGTLTSIATEIPGQDPGIELMALLDREVVLPARSVDPSDPNCQVTWALYRNEKSEYILRFDGNGEIPDTSSNTTPWLTEIQKLSSPYLHLEFGDGVKTIGLRTMQWLNISSIDWGGVTTIGTNAFQFGNGPKVVTIPGTVTTIRPYAFAWRTGVESFVLSNGNLTLTSHCFFTDSSTGSLHIPSTVSTLESVKARVSAYTVDENNPSFYAHDGVLFSTTHTTYGSPNTLKDYPILRYTEEYQIPTEVNGISVTRIGDSAFNSAESIGRLVIPPSVKSFGHSCFAYSHISEIIIQSGSSLSSIGNTPLKEATGLTNIQYPETAANPQNNKLHNLLDKDTVYDRYTHFTIPSGITSIGTMDGNLPNLKTLTYNAADADITNTDFFQTYGAYDLIVGNTVDNLPANFSKFASHAGAVRFQGVNTFTAASGAFAGAGEPLENLSGTFHVDANGVLYQCMGNNTAKVVYVPGDVGENFEIPETITIEDHSCTVTAVGQNALCMAENLKHLTFAKPENITSLDDYAMANCPTLTSVNAETTKEAAEATFTNTSLTKGSNLFYNTLLNHRYAGDQDGDGILNGTGQKDLLLQIEPENNQKLTMRISLSAGETMEWKGGDTGLYQLLTGDAIAVNISAGNTTGNTDYAYRVYFRTTGKDYDLSTAPGQTINYEGLDVTYTRLEEDPNVVYAEFCPPIGYGGSFQVNANYISPTSAGGGLEVYGVILGPGDTPPTLAQLFPTDKTIQLQWVTERDPFTLSKTGGNNVVGIVGDGSGSGKPASDLNWTIKLERKEETSPYYGNDFAESVVFTDIITLPTGFEWSKPLADALNSGPVAFAMVSDNRNDLKVNNLLALSIHSATKGKILSMNASWANEAKTALVITWERANNTTEDLSSRTLFFVVYPEAITIDMSKVDPTQTHEITNQVSAEVFYSHSAPDPLPAVSATNRLSGGEASLEMTKTSDDKNRYFFGEDITYTIDINNSGAMTYDVEAGNRVQVQDFMDRFTYIKPENMEKMFDGPYGSNLRITINSPILATWIPVTDVNGEQNAWLNSGNSNMGEVANSLVISKVNGKYRVVASYADGSTATFNENTAAEALRAAGYAVTRNDLYRLYWTLYEKDLTWIGGEHKLFYVYATVKDTFTSLSYDWPGLYPSKSRQVSNPVRSYLLKQDNTSSLFLPGDSVNDTAYREASIYKAVYKDNTPLVDGNASDGDVLTYCLNFNHDGTSSYESLPIVDDLYGCQYLLVPVIEANAHLSSCEIHTDEDGNRYYILKSGNYSDVTVGVADELNGIKDKYLVAASIDVGPAAGNVEVELGGKTVTYSGIHTKIKWYFPEMNGGIQTQVRYESLVDMSLCTSSTYDLGNAVWVNDRTDRRIYDFVWTGGTIIEFDKDIITYYDESPENDHITKYSPIAEGSEVTYRITLHNTNDADFHLYGDKLYDALPKTYGKFRWVKNSDDVQTDLPSQLVNLTKIEVVGKDGNGVQYDENLLNNWSIAGDGIANEGQQTIVWPEALDIKFTEECTLYLYFTLTYPDNNGDSETWTQYVTAANGTMISNKLYVYDFESAVHHDLAVAGEAMLKKGVSGVYSYGSNVQGITGSSYFEPSAMTRQYYITKGITQQAVQYYVTLYNGGITRLYLNDLYDKLPTGFSLFRMENVPAYNRLTQSIVGPLQTVPDHDTPLITIGNTSNDVVYCSATITPIVTGTDNIIKFQITDVSAAGKSNYDEAKGKYYLNHGEAIVFGYVCDVAYMEGETAENGVPHGPATNTIAMPYDNYLDTELNLSEASVIANRLKYSNGNNIFVDENNGECVIMQNDQVVNDYNFQDSGADQDWLVSWVDLKEGQVVPGVSKTPTGYSTPNYPDEFKPLNDSFVSPDNIIQWTVTLRNDGTQAMQNYIFTDTLEAPYLFEGDITFRFYDSNGKYLRDRFICDINKRSELQRDENGNVKPHTLTGKGYNNTVFSLVADGEWHQIWNEYMYMRVGYDADGNEVLSLRMVPGSVSIPIGGYCTVTLSARNPQEQYLNRSYANSAVLEPSENQAFTDITTGSRLFDESGNPYAVYNYSKVDVAVGAVVKSEKRVTEVGAPENTAVSTDQNDNKIILKDTDSHFTYQLTVENTTEIALKKLVIIDNLPEENDHLTLSSYDRSSAFKVNFADNPNFKVNVITDGTSTPLDSTSQYTLQFSDSTEFGKPYSADWKGEETGKWSNTRTANSRSFRLIITDDAGTLIPSKSKVEVSFDAKVGDDAEPAEIAWNNFGYHVVLNDEFSTELEAMPDPVAVAIPSVPSLKKELIDWDGNPEPAANIMNFTFVIYEGEEFAGIYDSASTLTNALKEAGRPYWTVTAPVKKGDTESADIQLTAIPWEHGKKYNVVEFCPNKVFRFDTMNNDHRNLYTFTYNEAANHSITCVNKLQEWAIKLTKVDSADENKKLPGAIFALYSPSTAEWNIPSGDKSLGVAPKLSFGNGWYLKAITTTDSSGELSWTNLQEDEYYLLEVKAPAGYNLNKDGMTVKRSDSVSGIKYEKVKNSPGYELPESGGMGTPLFYIFGSIMMLAAVVLLDTKKRRSGTA